MNYKQSLNGFLRTNWNNKSDVQKIKLLKNHFEKLGYKEPKYLQNKKISNKQLEKTLLRIEKGYNKKIEKQVPNVKLSDLQYEGNKVNKLIDKRINQLKHQGFSDKAIRFLQGEQIFSTLSDRSFFSNNSLLEKVDLTNFTGNKKGRAERMRQIKEQQKQLKSSDYFKKVLNSDRNIKEFKNLFNDDLIFGNLDISDRQYLESLFNNLNVVQQEILLQTTIKEIREKYEDFELQGEHLQNTIEKISNHISIVKKEI